MPLNINAVAIPAEQRGYGQSVTKIVQARPSGISGITQADFMRQFHECPSNTPFGQAATSLGQKECWIGGDRKQTIPARRVASQSGLCCRVHGYVARFAKLRAANRQHTIVEIDIATIEPRRFVASQPCCGVKTEDRGIRLGS